ncbi:MAG: hypothetical protein CM1200mP29_11930 [Verrucomicrobiota bacterium]|nr:MAG: hypothetical protein CM1200mP29_11930 [Verrucomicrobiota bacterium]
MVDNHFFFSAWSNVDPAYSGFTHFRPTLKDAKGRITLGLQPLSPFFYPLIKQPAMALQCFLNFGPWPSWNLVRVAGQGVQFLRLFFRTEENNCFCSSPFGPSSPKFF